MLWDSGDQARFVGVKKKLKKATSRIRTEECVGASQSSQSKAKEREENFQAYVKWDAREFQKLKAVLSGLRIEIEAGVTRKGVKRNTNEEVLFNLKWRGQKFL